jgi:hypothetical protein
MTQQPGADVHNPVEVERAIRDCSARIGRMVVVCRDTYAAFLEADRTFDRAVARAYLAYNRLPAHERKHRAELATQDERQARDVADVAYRYARDQANAAESELRAWQSVGASVRAMWSVAGRGDGA